MKKILFVATVTEHFYYFHLPYIKLFRDLGWQVDVASHGDIELPGCSNRYEIPIRRSPKDKDNLRAYRMLKKIIRENEYDIIHCHTPMGGILARLAAASERRKGTKVLYTAHGFHFYKGASWKNWLVFFPIERVMSHLTDCLITINDEDFACAEKRLKAKQTVKVNGVGYNSDMYYPVSPQTKHELREKLGYSDSEKLLVYVAEMNKNKNQSMLLEAVRQLREKFEDIRLLIVGADNFDGRYIALAKSIGVADCVNFLGHRNDAADIVHASDIAVGSSLREGLPVNVMEALACGLPAVLADNRGHRSLVKNGVNGYLVPANDSVAMADRIAEILSDSKLYDRLSQNAVENIKPYSKEAVLEEMKKIYFECIN